VTSFTINPVKPCEVADVLAVLTTISCVCAVEARMTGRVRDDFGACSLGAYFREKHLIREERKVYFAKI
jgi:hypothetical protein